MTEYSDTVERQRLLLEAEEWAEGVSSIHVHGFSSMWYDTRPQDTANGQMVCDTTYNNGIIERKKDGKLIHTFGKKLTGDELIAAYERNNL